MSQSESDKKRFFTTYFLRDLSKCLKSGVEPDGRFLGEARCDRSTQRPFGRKSDAIQPEDDKKPRSTPFGKYSKGSSIIGPALRTLGKT
jgi:hypothetical protein